MNKKKAFTLTELLVVVVVIGVLAAVVLPKYNAMLETRKTTEAESVLTAVRNEQELRCAADERYTTKYDRLASLSTIQKAGAYDNRAKSSNFTYIVAGSGVSAQNNKAEYTLKIPSYRDGRICCEGSGCDTLNKDYVRCDTFTPRQSPASCAPEAGGGGEEPEPPTPPECATPNPSGDTSVGECGIKHEEYTCNAGTWELVSSFTEPNSNAAKPTWDGQETPCYECGRKTRNAVCNTSSWKWEEAPGTGQCKYGGEVITSKEQCCDLEEYQQPWEEGTCNTCGKKRMQVVCDYPTGNWREEVVGCTVSDPSECDGNCDGNEKRACEEAYSTWGDHAWWDSDRCKCVCDVPGEEWNGRGCSAPCQFTGENLAIAQHECERTPHVQGAVGGIWSNGENGLDCGCMCPPFAHLITSDTYPYCAVSPDDWDTLTFDNDECERRYGGVPHICEQFREDWERMKDDYDDYLDWLDGGRDDWDDDRDYDY